MDHCSNRSSRGFVNGAALNDHTTIYCYNERKVEEINHKMNRMIKEIFDCQSKNGVIT